MPHPLDGATLRLKRANRHLAEADQLIAGFGNECEKYVVTDKNNNITRLDGWPDVPNDLPVVVSDAIHNFRAALDYIVYELAREDFGSVVDGTQFIIEDIKSDPVHPNRGFDGRKKTYLKGLTPDHVDAIERLQPYNGVHWTKALRDISNPDKHRTLTVLDSTYRSISVSMHHKPTGRFGMPGRLVVTNKGVTFASYDIKVDATHAIAIAPSDASKPSLMSTLRLIETEVGNTIQAFKPEFKI